MDIQLQIIIVIAVLIGMTVLVLMVRKKALELRYALVWFVMGAGVLVLGIFPGLMNQLSYLMGIAAPVNMLFFIGFCFSLAIIFTLTVAISRMSKRMKSLAQAIALLQSSDGYELKRNEEQIEENSEKQETKAEEEIE